MRIPEIYNVRKIDISHVEWVLDADTPKSKKKFERSTIKSSRALLLRRYLRKKLIISHITYLLVNEDWLVLALWAIKMFLKFHFSLPGSAFNNNRYKLKTIPDFLLDENFVS